MLFFKFIINFITILVRNGDDVYIINCYIILGIYQMIEDEYLYINIFYFVVVAPSIGLLFTCFPILKSTIYDILNKINLKSW